MNLQRLFLRADGPSRRSFLTGAASGLLGVGGVPWLARLAAAQEPGGGPIGLRPATARQVIYLYMSGGMSQLDTFDPKPGAPTQGPTKAIDTKADNVRVSEHFRNLARQMDKVAVIRSMRTTQGAHDQGRYFMHTGYELRGTIQHPSMGAWLDHMAGPLNPTLPGHVSINGSRYTATAGFLPSQHAPLPIGDPERGLAEAHRPEQVDAETFERRMQRVQEMNRAFAAEHGRKDVSAYADMYDQAVRLMSSSDLAAFELEREPEQLRDAYGRDRFGQGCLLARRLVERGVRFVEVGLGGWDTHVDNFDTLQDRVPELDQALAALLADLDARGMLEETLVVVATEFGRTPRINDNDGRDHWPQSFSCALAGGGVNGGMVYGATSATGEEIVEKPVFVTDFNATIAWALGLPLDHRVFSPSGRPFTVADKGQPVTELFA
ncbi:MAG TPA: DUF1501 domain-containing protein [Planctomycetota bacterium]